VNTRRHSLDMDGDEEDDFGLISSVDTVFNSVTNTNEFYYGTYIDLADGYSVKIQNLSNELF